MARPKTDLPPAEEIRALIDSDGRLVVRVLPGARSETLVIESGGLLVKTRAKAQDGAANAAVIVQLAKVLGRAPTRIELLRGATSRNKLLRIDS